MLSTNGLLICRTLKLLPKTSTLKVGRLDMVFKNHSTLQNHNASVLNTFLSKTCCRKLPRRYFKSKDESGTVKSRVSRSRVRQGGRSNANEDSANFLPFAIKVGAYTTGFTVVTFGVCALWQQYNNDANRKRWHESKINRKQEIRNWTQMWNHLSMVHKVTYTIAGINLLVFAGWKIANPQVMMKWFTLSLNGGKNVFTNMFLSMFSHKTFLHLFVNMYVLNSFCVAWDFLSLKSSTNANGHERYAAFYLAAGMCSGLLSILVKHVGRIPHPSLGASGAIMGLVGYVCEKMPNNRLGIVFIPNWTFTAGSAKNFIIAFDTVGLLVGVFTKWRYMIFDHAGHLGGILFGIWYAKHGEKFLNDFSEYIMRLSKRRK